MVRQHYQLNGHEFEQSLGDSEGQGSLACCSLWGHKELDTTQQMNKTITVLIPLYRLVSDALKKKKTPKPQLLKITIIYFS